MSEIDLVKKFYEHLGSGNRQAAYSLLAEDFVLKQADSLPYGGAYIGEKGLDEFFKKFFGFWKEFKTLQTAYYSSDRTVFAVSTVRGVTMHQETIIETEMVQVYVVENQQLISAQPFYFDTKKLTS